MGPEGNILENSSISTFQQGLTHSAVRNHKLKLAYSPCWNVKKKIIDMCCVFVTSLKTEKFFLLQLFLASQQIISQANHPKGLISKFLHIIYI